MQAKKGSAEVGDLFSIWDILGARSTIPNQIHYRLIYVQNQIRKVQILRVNSARSSSNQAEQHHGSFSDHQALEPDDLSCSKNRNGIEIRWNPIAPSP